MYSYEFTCNKCNAKINAELSYELNYNYYCPCGSKMDLVFFLKSPDTRAEEYTMLNLDDDNNVLKVQINALKAQLAGDTKEIQYESSIYKSNTWDTSMYETQVDFE